jgi:hypothetical protein
MLLIAAVPRWCSGVFQFTCRYGDVVRIALGLDSHDRRDGHRTNRFRGYRKANRFRRPNESETVVPAPEAV